MIMRKRSVVSEGGFTLQGDMGWQTHFQKALGGAKALGWETQTEVRGGVGHSEEPGGLRA